MTQIAILESIQTGTPHTYPRRLRDGRERTWSTSFFRAPVAGPLRLFTTHLEGTEQADTLNHGTLNQAVLLYAASHYALWREELGRPDMRPGGFGENFTVAGLSEESACLADVYAIGEALITVTGPRYPCWKIEERWQHPGLTDRVAETGRTGWYCAVAREGTVEAGMEVRLLDRPYPRWTMALINAFGHGRNDDRTLAENILACPALPSWWSDLIRHRLH